MTQVINNVVSVYLNACESISGDIIRFISPQRRTQICVFQLHCRRGYYKCYALAITEVFYLAFDFPPEVVVRSVRLPRRRSSYFINRLTSSPFKLPLRGAKS